MKEHKIIFRPAYDKTDPDHVSSVTILFRVMGEGKATEFQLNTNWYLPNVVERRINYLHDRIYEYLGENKFLLKSWLVPFPADVCYFSLKRISEDDCYFENGIEDLFDGKPCYYSHKYELDESENLWTTDAIYLKFIRDGEEAVWEYLEEYYKEIFG